MSFPVVGADLLDVGQVDDQEHGDADVDSHQHGADVEP